MPQNVDFYVPFGLRTNPETEQARGRHEAWIKASGILPHPRLWDLYAAWDFPQLVGYVYPTAEGERLDLAMNTLGMSFVWDDQHESLSARDPARAVAHTRDIISVFHHPPERFTGQETALGVRLWAQLWHEMSRGMSSAWRVRAARDWEYMAVCFPHQARDRVLGVPDLRHYTHLRRGVAGSDSAFSTLEAIWGCEVPPLAFHSPQLRQMHDAIALTTMWCNDVYSLEKEEADGDVDNIVPVLEKARHLSRKEAVEEVVRMVETEIRLFERLREDLLAMVSYLGLDTGEAAAVMLYTQALQAWFRGYHEWEQSTDRYAGTKASVGRRPAVETLVAPPQ